MSIHFFSCKSVLSDLKSGKLTETDAALSFLLLLASSFFISFISFSCYLPDGAMLLDRMKSYMGSCYKSFYFSFVIENLFHLIVVSCAFFINRRGDGKDFLKRLFSFALPISVLYHLYYLVSFLLIMILEIDYFSCHQYKVELLLFSYFGIRLCTWMKRASCISSASE